MTRTASGYLPNMIGVLTLEGDGTEQTVKRGTINFVGATVTDDPVNERTDVEITGGGGGTPAGSSGDIQTNDAGSFGALTPGTGVATFLATPSSANLKAAVTDETGTGGALVFADTPTLVTPVIGAATGTSAALSSYWSTGATPATTGAGRMAINAYIYSRDSGNTADIRVIGVSASGPEQINIGGGASGYNLMCCGGTISFRNSAASVVYASFDGTSFTLPAATALWLTATAGAGYNFKFSTASAIAADRTVTLPLLTGNDTFVFEAHTATLTNKTLTSPAISSPTISGSPIFSATDASATGNARGKIYSNIASVQTTDATVTSLYTWTILDEAVTLATYEGCADLSTGADTAAYVRRIKFKRDGGTVTAGTVETTFTDESDATWDCTIDNSTSTGRVRVTGKAASTIDHAGVVTRMEVSHA